MAHNNAYKAPRAQNFQRLLTAQQAHVFIRLNTARESEHLSIPPFLVAENGDPKFLETAFLLRQSEGGRGSALGWAGVASPPSKPDGASTSEKLTPFHGSYVVVASHQTATGNGSCEFGIDQKADIWQPFVWTLPRATYYVLRKVARRMQNFATPRAREDMYERVSSKSMAVETGLGSCSSSDGMERSLFDAWDPRLGTMSCFSGRVVLEGSRRT